MVTATAKSAVSVRGSDDQQSLVSSESGRLNENLRSLREAIGELHRRLLPVLRDRLQDGAKLNEAPSGIPRWNVARAFSDAAVSVEEARNDISAILDDLEV